MNRDEIREHQMVHARGEGSMNGASGVHVGTVDKVEGEFVKLTRNDSPDGQHRWIPLSWIERVDSEAIYLSKTSDEFRQGAMTNSPVEDQGSGQGATYYATNEERMDRLAQTGTTGAFGQGGEGAVTREEVETAFNQGNPDATVGNVGGNMAGGLGTQLGGASGIESIGGTRTGRDVDLGGNAPGSGGAMLGTMSGGMQDATALGAGGTMDDGMGGTMDGPNAGMGDVSSALGTSGTGRAGSPDTGAMGRGSAASGHIAGGTGSTFGSMTGGDTTNPMENIQSGGAGGADFGGLPSSRGGTLDHRDPLSDDTALGSAGGSMLSDREIGLTGADSPMGDARSSSVAGGLGGSGGTSGNLNNLGNPNSGGTTDRYEAAGMENLSTDRTLQSGDAGGRGAYLDDRNSATGRSGNVSNEDGLPGQGTDSQRSQNTQGSQPNEDGVQGMDAYDNSYSGGSAAMPPAGGSAATPDRTMNTNLDPALAGSDFDREAMGQAVEERQGDTDDENRRG